MKALPDNLTFVRSTPVFTENSIPKGLLKAHTTKAGTWGKIVIESGELVYTIDEGEFAGQSFTLTPDNFGVVEPQILHSVRADNSACFRVDFYH